MGYPTYLPPGDLDIAQAFVDLAPCARCGRPPAEHPFDLICPMGSDEPAATVEHASPKRGQTRIMYVEQCADGANHRGPAWIGRVTFSKSGRSLYYRGMHLARIPGKGVVGNYRDVHTGVEYWVSAPKRDGSDRHWAGGGPVHVDLDIRREYEASRLQRRRERRSGARHE